MRKPNLKSSSSWTVTSLAPMTRQMTSRSWIMNWPVSRALVVEIDCSIWPCPPLCTPMWRWTSRLAAWDQSECHGNINYRQTSYISCIKAQNLNVTHLVLQFSIEARCWVENEDVVGAAPIGDAPTTSEWSTTLLPTKVWLILEVWVYITKNFYILIDLTSIWCESDRYMCNWCLSEDQYLLCWQVELNWMGGSVSIDVKT